MMTHEERAKVFDPTVPDKERLALALSWIHQLRLDNARLRGVEWPARYDAVTTDADKPKE